jgi:isoleucyl-tRNA synthetase
MTVALDVTLTDELKQEGIARDLVNRIQNLRKDMGLEVQDKINIKVAKHDALVDAALKQFCILHPNRNPGTYVGCKRLHQ